VTKTVVLGGDGFIGRHLVAELASSGSERIVAFDRFALYQGGADHPWRGQPNVEVVAGDFFNRDDVAAVLDGADYVFHLVSTTNPATSLHDPLIDIDTNVRGTVELLQLCVAKGVRKVVFVSSGGTVYGNVDSDRIDESMLTAPLSPYAIGKLTIENYLRYFKFTSGLDYIVYRAANPYGPGQNILGKQGVIPIFMHSVLEKRPVTILGDGSMVRDYVYIGDLTRMIASSYAPASKHEVYNLGSGHGTTVNRLAEAIQECAGYPVEKVFSPMPPTYVQRSVLNIDRFVGEFQLSPSTSLEDGLARTWAHLKEARPPG
jgi:UDP-glucose 4-epimerase